MRAPDDRLRTRGITLTELKRRRTRLRWHQASNLIACITMTTLVTWAAVTHSGELFVMIPLAMTVAFCNGMSTHTARVAEREIARAIAAIQQRRQAGI